MPRILLLLPNRSYRIRDFLNAAMRSGAEVVVATDKASSMGPKHADRLLALDFRSPAAAADRVRQFHETNPIDAVIPVDDETAVAAAAIGQALGLRTNSVESVLVARDKGWFAEVAAAHGLPVPRSVTFDIGADPETVAREVSYPCVLKPTFLSASQGVIRADTPGAFVDAWKRIGTILARPDVRARGGASATTLLVQDYVPGIEVALEGLLTRGRLRTLALFDKPDPLDGPFFEETIYVTPSRLPWETRQAVETCVASSAAALGLTEGPVHAELRVNDQGSWIIEIAARSIGGLCSRTLRFAAQLSLEELLVSHALGWDYAQNERETRAAGVMMIPIPNRGILEAVRGTEAARLVPGIEEVTITAAFGRKIEPLPEGSSYLGFIFSRADTPEEAETSLRQAWSRLEIEIR